MATNNSSDYRDKYLGKLYLGSKAATQQYARELRLRTTSAEKELWSLLRNRQLKGKKFRRQHAIANYIVDFYCNECKLAIELDGNFHTNEVAKDYDKSRTAFLAELGITVLRFWNEEVISNLEKVVEKIGAYLQ
jgi:very-short-patch-repair endonuclease